MGSFFRRLVTPWRMEAEFSSQEEFFAFLRRYNRVVGAVRTVLLLAAAISLLTSYALDRYKINLIAAAALVIVMLISLPVLQNEKKLPKEDAKS